MKRLLTLLTTTAVMVLMFASAGAAEVLPPTGHNGCDVCEDVFGAIAGPTAIATAIATAEGSVGCDVCLYYINRANGGAGRQG